MKCVLMTWSGEWYVLLPGGVCEDEAAGGRRSSARRLRGKPALSSSIHVGAARGQKFPQKLTFVFSTHCIQVFASIYGSYIHIASLRAIFAG